MYLNLSLIYIYFSIYLTIYLLSIYHDPIIHLYMYYLSTHPLYIYVHIHPLSIYHYLPIYLLSIHHISLMYVCIYLSCIFQSTTIYHVFVNIPICPSMIVLASLSQLDNLTQTRASLEEGSLIKKKKTCCPVGKAIVHCLD